MTGCYLRVFLAVVVLTIMWMRFARYVKRGMDSRLHDAYFVEYRIPRWLVIVAIATVVAIAWSLWRKFRLVP